MSLRVYGMAVMLLLPLFAASGQELSDLTDAQFIDHVRDLREGTTRSVVPGTVPEAEGRKCGFGISVARQNARLRIVYRISGRDTYSIEAQDIIFRIAQGLDSANS